MPYQTTPLYHLLLVSITSSRFRLFFEFVFFVSSISSHQTTIHIITIHTRTSLHHHVIPLYSTSIYITRLAYFHRHLTVLIFFSGYLSLLFPLFSLIPNCYSHHHKPDKDFPASSHHFSLYRPLACSRHHLIVYYFFCDHLSLLLPVSVTS